jgi:LmbE family N-acetylglucosaminyl deacetylase
MSTTWKSPQLRHVDDRHWVPRRPSVFRLVLVHVAEVRPMYVDDEASQTAGSMARAADEGHRVVLVIATNGDHGDAPPDLAEGQTVAARRRLEAEQSGRVLGVARIVWLGYADSGMTGWEQNSSQNALMGADLDEAARAVAAVLDDEDADVVTGYDWHGGYGHPDHVAVHRIAHRAAEFAARRPKLLEVTMNRDAMRELWKTAQAGQTGQAALVGPEDWDPDAPADDGNPIGTPEAQIHLRVDVKPYLSRKRAALAAHASQTTDVGMMLALPHDVFAAIFGTEYFIEPGREPGIRTGWIFDSEPARAATAAAARSTPTGLGPRRS